MIAKPHLWLRAEHKPLEARALVTPTVAAQLLAAGYRVTVEASPQRAIALQAYVDAGCETAAYGSWQLAPDTVIVLGLKELDAQLGPFRHRHVHFAHVYKEQQGWQATLRQFSAGGGTLYDLEYLVDDAGRRVAAFGYWAGYVGAALAVMAWANRQHAQTPSLTALTPWTSRHALQASVRAALLGPATDASCQSLPRAMVIGALGRSGQGAVELCQACEIPVTQWDVAETAAGGPFDAVLQHDVLINCVYVSQAIPPFTSHEHLNNPARRLAVIADVSCDPYGDANALPIYARCTTLDEPSLRLLDANNGCPALDMIAIDHLPSLLPVESSEDFARQLAPHLLQVATEHSVWDRALKLFREKTRQALTTGTVHWLGAGLSTVPGIRRMANSGQRLIVWNRSVDKATAALADTLGMLKGNATAATLDWAALETAITEGDVIVSMLPGDFHVRVAELCLAQGAHFVSSSYIPPAIAAMHDATSAVGLCFVNEVGLDPGIDHLFAHSLLWQYRESHNYAADNRLYFRSYCGGFPAIPNDFRYKFSWSPSGVLKALKTPAQWIDNGRVQQAGKPWESIKPYSVQLANGLSEEFEAYPNRDSLPFIKDYHFDPDWPVEQFVRGTLRLSGWSRAWHDLFAELDTLEGDSGMQRLAKISSDLWQNHAYGIDEKDRVVLCVELEARNSQGDLVWHKSHVIDEVANASGSAMSRLVSLTVSMAVDDVLAGRMPVGVQAAPSEKRQVARWLSLLDELGESVHTRDHHRQAECASV
jgi:saccharopine dehydrogenase (NADP+, L-glutamate forming)